MLSKAHNLSRQCQTALDWGPLIDIQTLPTQPLNLSRQRAEVSVGAAAVAWEERSCNPAKPSRRWRSTHLRTVRGQAPTASLTAFGVCPFATNSTIRSRPRGISRAFYARSSGPPGIAELRHLQLLPARAGWTTYGKLTARCDRTLVRRPVRLSLGTARLRRK